MTFAAELQEGPLHYTSKASWYFAFGKIKKVWKKKKTSSLGCVGTNLSRYPKCECSEKKNYLPATEALWDMLRIFLFTVGLHTPQALDLRVFAYPSSIHVRAPVPYLLHMHCISGTSAVHYPLYSILSKILAFQGLWGSGEEWWDVKYVYRQLVLNNSSFCQVCFSFSFKYLPILTVHCRWLQTSPGGRYCSPLWTVTGQLCQMHCPLWRLLLLYNVWWGSVWGFW